ncbi:hypothetical protein E8E12_010362 [Didymella heteroderae]|uniref:DNA binding n=1 Tax=Didymella heteroderae TaxID=1769908 RepID=A0A9P4WYX6_9PLEO|nr:hypothetical protein E8E12_010362 [Didymella heteroderae]
MPPKAQPGAARRGRPASNAVSEIPPSPKKRGRPAKADAVAAAAVEPPKKRGRPAKVQPDEPIAQIDQAIKRGRRSVAAAEEVVAEAPVPIKKRVGRPAKAAAVAEVATAPKKRGRPALHLNRVAGSPRVAKRTSPRSKTAARALPKAAAAPRINPKMRSRLRTRTAPVEKKIVVEPVKKARGRPKKVEVEEIPATKKASAPKKAVGHVRKASAPVPVAPAKKMTARSKTAAPRKRRGYTSFEVADKFAAQVKQYILDLQAEDAADAAAAAAGEADDEGEGIEVEVELGTEDATGHPDNLQAEAEVNELAAELAEDEEEDKDEHMLVDPMEIAQSVALDQEQLNRDTDGAAEMAPESDEFEDETELPSETAVLAEIAAVQDELGAKNDIEQDVEIAEAAQVELERGSSASHQSVDLHEEITEVSSIPQVDGSKEVEVFHAHIDEHNHVLNTPAPEPAAGASVGSLFSGF